MAEVQRGPTLGPPTAAGAGPLAKNRAAGRPGLDNDTANTVLVHFAGHSLRDVPMELLQATVAKWAETLGRPLQQAQQGAALKEYCWMPTLKPGTGKWSGQLWLHTACLDEASPLYRRLHGMSLWTGSAWCHLAVVKPLLPVWASSPAPGGSAGPASGPPDRR